MLPDATPNCHCSETQVSVAVRRKPSHSRHPHDRSTQHALPPSCTPIMHAPRSARSNTSSYHMHAAGNRPCTHEICRYTQGQALCCVNVACPRANRRPPCSRVTIRKLCHTPSPPARERKAHLHKKVPAVVLERGHVVHRLKHLVYYALHLRLRHVGKRRRQKC